MSGEHSRTSWSCDGCYDPNPRYWSSLVPNQWTAKSNFGFGRTQYSSLVHQSSKSRWNISHPKHVLRKVFKLILTTRRSPPIKCASQSQSDFKIPVWNLMSVNLGQKCLIGEAWCPVADIDRIQLALRRGTERCRGSVNSILWPRRHISAPTNSQALSKAGIHIQKVKMGHFCVDMMWSVSVTDFLGHFRVLKNRYEIDFKMAQNSRDRDRPRDWIYIQTSKWPNYVFPFVLVKLQNGP